MPFAAQLGAGADFGVGDCGMACLAMVLAARGVRVSVDALGQAAGFGAGYGSASYKDLIRVGAMHGVQLVHRTLTVLDVMDRAVLGQATICLVNYLSLPAACRFTASYDGGHWVVARGVEDGAVVMNDPFWPAGCGRGDGERVPVAAFDLAWRMPSRHHRGGRQCLVEVVG